MEPFHEGSNYGFLQIVKLLNEENIKNNRRLLKIPLQCVADPLNSNLLNLFANEVFIAVFEKFSYLSKSEQEKLKLYFNEMKECNQPRYKNLSKKPAIKEIFCDTPVNIETTNTDTKKKKRKPKKKTNVAANENQKEVPMPSNAESELYDPEKIDSDTNTTKELCLLDYYPQIPSANVALFGDAENNTPVQSTETAESNGVVTKKQRRTKRKRAGINTRKHKLITGEPRDYFNSIRPSLIFSSYIKLLDYMVILLFKHELEPSEIKVLINRLDELEKRKPLTSFFLRYTFKDEAKFYDITKPNMVLQIPGPIFAENKSEFIVPQQNKSDEEKKLKLEEEDDTKFNENVLYPVDINDTEEENSVYDDKKEDDSEKSENINSEVTEQINKFNDQFLPSSNCDQNWYLNFFTTITAQNEQRELKLNYDKKCQVFNDSYMVNNHK